MIFLDAERFIEEAIESVFAQTFVDWELLLVDDGSTDSSTGIALRYEAANPGRVRYLEHEGHRNLGMSASRNLGVLSARGTYIAFLDSDDVWLPEKLTRQVAVLEERAEAAMVYGPTQFWYGWTGDPADASKDHVTQLGVDPETLVQPPELLALYLESEGAITPGICSLLARREKIEAVGGFEDVFRGTFEDQVFLSKMCFSYPVFVTGERLDRYRQHDDSACAKTIESGEYHPAWANPARGRYLRWLGDYLSERGCEDARVWRAYRKELRPYRPVVGRLDPRRWGGLVPRRVRQWLKFLLLRGSPPIGYVRFGTLRRVTPISRYFGYDRGLPVDRYYIEGFLATHATAVKGRTLEVGDSTYTQRYGGGKVTRSDVLHVDLRAPGATVIADLAEGDSIPSDSFDCFICTQTLHLIHDVPAAIDTIFRILKPSGVLLATLPGVSQISRDEWSRTWSWSFSTSSARRLFEQAFPRESLQVEAYGNVLVATAFLHGLAAEELRPEELDFRDPQYEFLITVRAVKPSAAPEHRSGGEEHAPKT